MIPLTKIRIRLNHKAGSFALLAFLLFSYAYGEEGLRVGEKLTGIKLVTCGLSHCFTIVSPEASRSPLSAAYALDRTELTGTPRIPGAKPLHLTGVDGVYDPALKIVILRADSGPWQEASVSLSTGIIEYFK